MKFPLNTTLLYVCLFFVTAFSVSCQKGNDTPKYTTFTKIPHDNMDFEQKLVGWQIETAYTGFYGFSADTGALRSGKYGLNFFAPQAGEWAGSPQETPWNGKIYATFTNLKDGNYTFKIYADAVGDGMFLWVNGGTEATAKIKSDNNELNTLDFTVKGGTAKVGFACINANGNKALFAPYFHADDAELWLNE